MKIPERHVAVCAFPYGTHAAPLLLLVKRLASAFPDTLFSFINAEFSNAALFATANDAADATHANVVPYNVSVSAAEPGYVGNPVLPFLKGAAQNYRRRMEEVEEEVGVKISCVISDAFLWFCGEFALENGLRWIPVWTANAVSLSAHFHTDVLRTKFGVLSQGSEGQEDELDNELEDVIPGFSNIRIRDLPSGIITGDIDSPFSLMLYKMQLMLPKATAVVVNSYEKLSPTITDDLKSKMRLLCVGPFPMISPPQVQKSDVYDCLPWLDKQKEKSVVYISFGTVSAPPPHEIVAIAEALERSRVPFLWSMSESNKGHLSSRFIEDENFGKIVHWAPQVKLLGHPSVGAFVTHCGWNSVLESIINGVPLICRPMLGDQMINQRFIESVINVGVGVEGGAFTEGGMMKALQKVITSDQGKEMRKNAQVLKELANESTKPSGSSIANLNALIEVIASPHQK